MGPIASHSIWKQKKKLFLKYLHSYHLWTKKKFVFLFILFYYANWLKKKILQKEMFHQNYEIWTDRENKMKKNRHIIHMALMVLDLNFFFSPTVAGYVHNWTVHKTLIVCKIDSSICLHDFFFLFSTVDFLFFFFKACCIQSTIVLSYTELNPS